MTSPATSPRVNPMFESSSAFWRSRIASPISTITVTPRKRVRYRNWNTVIRPVAT